MCAASLVKLNDLVTTYTYLYAASGWSCVTLSTPTLKATIHNVVARGVDVRFHESRAEPMRMWENRMKIPGIEGECGM